MAELDGSDRDRDEPDNGEVFTQESVAVNITADEIDRQFSGTDNMTMQKPDRGAGSAITSLAALLLAFVVGLLIGYVARPFTDQLAAGGPAETIAQSQAMATNEPPPDDSQSQEANDGQLAVQGETDDGVGDEAPVLITPTPDRSVAIAALIQQNVRHFVGDEDAPVTLIEFSDFL